MGGPHGGRAAVRLPGCRAGGIGSHSLRGCFVTGTDTGAGKTVVAAALAAALRVRGKRPAVFKPVLTGTDTAPDPDWPPDDLLLATAAGVASSSVTARLFGPAVSPHLAAELAGVEVEPASLTSAAIALAETSDLLVVEGVGGLLVPLTAEYSVRDLARELALPLLIAARPGLGTINHCLLTLEAARAAELEVLAVVFSPWPVEPSVMQRSNRATVERLGSVETVALPVLCGGDLEQLGSAGARLAELLLDDDSDRAAG